MKKIPGGAKQNRGILKKRISDMADEMNKSENSEINNDAERKKASNKQMITIVPRFYAGIFAGIILILTAFLLWAVFGSVDRMITVPGIYHPNAVASGQVVVFVPLSDGKPLEAGMQAKVFPEGYDLQKTGFMVGEVTYVDKEVTTMEEMRALLSEDTVISLFAKNGPMLALEVRLKEDPSTVSGYYWSEPGGRELTLYDMTMTSVNITLEEVRPISLGIPQLKELFESQ